MTQLLIKKKKRRGKEKKKEKGKEGKERRRKEGKKKKKINNASKKISLSKLHSVRVPKTELYPRSLKKD